MYDCCIDMPILSINRVVHKKLMFVQLSLHDCARLDVYAVAERVTPVLVHVSYKMQQIKTSRILMLQIKPVTKLKSLRDKPAIRYLLSTAYTYIYHKYIYYRPPPLFHLFRYT